MKGIRYITLPFWRIIPYEKGKNPFSEEDYPNEPTGGYVMIPVFIYPAMEEDDIFLEAIRIRNNLIDKWFADKERMIP